MSWLRSLFSSSSSGGGDGRSRREVKLHTKLEQKYGLESGGCSRCAALPAFWCMHARRSTPQRV